MTVSEEIIKVLDFICEKIGITIDWTAENVMPYVGELMGKLIKYEISTSIAWIVIMILLSIASIVAAKKLAPTFQEGLNNQGPYDCGWDFLTAGAIVALIVLNGATIIVVGTQIMDIIKCITFPEMAITDYINALLNKS